MSRRIIRDFNPRNIRVATIHPQVGQLPRGRIVPLAPDGWQGRWQVIDADHEQVGEVVGDYLDAETALLEATAALDEPVPADEFTDED
jgi:hypothetical protein